MILNNYLDLIEKQRIKFPNHKKDYDLISLPPSFQSVSEVIEELSRWPNAFVTGIIYRNIPLYKNNNENYYYEFIDIGNIRNSNIENWRYFYIPLSFANDLNIPKFKFYDINISSNIQKYNYIQPDLFINNLTNEFFYIITVEEYIHPLLPNFIFTGRCKLNSQGIMLYEYIDTKEYFNINSVSYLSNLSPLNFYIPTTILNNNQVTKDILNIELIGSNPSKLNIYSNLEDLRYTGYSTTDQFSKVKKWYEYYLYENGFPVTRVLLDSPPTNLNLNSIYINYNNLHIGLNLHSTDNTQYLNINQTSNNKIINLY